MLTFEEEVDALATPELLTERQAEAFVLREVELVPRHEAAESMDVTVSTLDDRRGEAVRKIDAARETIDALDAVRDQLPDGDAAGDDG
jgi:DNA-directed RNA polymerase specialized sigma24 family protein